MSAAEPALELREVAGPTARGTDLGRLLRLTWAMAVTDFKLRFFGSALGYLWQLMRPLLLFGVLYVVFSTVLNVSGDVPHYPVALLLGLVLFSFFSEATGGSVRSIVLRENLVRKIEFPRLAVPAAAVLTSVFNLLLNMIPVLVFLLAAGVTPKWSWLEMPVLMVVLIGFCFGLAMLLSAAFVRFRDVEPIWDVVLQILFYATPIFYTTQVVAEKAGERWAHVLMLNPLAVIIQQARYALISPVYGSAATEAGGIARLLIPLAIGVGLFVIGSVVFSREAPVVAEHL
jgi:ABC-2 type transport system permease protein